MGEDQSPQSVCGTGGCLEQHVPEAAPSPGDGTVQWKV